MNRGIGKTQLLSLIAQLITLGTTILLLSITIILLIITWKYMDFSKDMAGIMYKQYRVQLDSLIEAREAWSLPTYPIGKEAFQVGNSYILPIQLLEYDFQWWHRDNPERKFKSTKKNINKVIKPTTSFEVIEDIDLSPLNMADINRDELWGKIDYHMILKFKVGNEYISKEIIRGE